MVTPTSLNGAYWALAVPAASVDATKSPAMTVLMNASLVWSLASPSATFLTLAPWHRVRKPLRFASLRPRGAVAGIAVLGRGMHGASWSTIRGGSTGSREPNAGD